MKKLLKQRSLKKGFTLIELLIVIAIIAILATIIILNVSSARTKANDTKVLSEIEGANKGAIACSVENQTPIAPLPSGATGTPNQRVVIDSSNISVCSSSAAGLDAKWPYLGQANTAYSGWAYSTNAAASNGTWTWTAVNGTKTIQFTQQNTSKTGTW